MSLINWIKSLLSRRGKALSYYRAGMAKANQRNYAGAIADYSAAIQVPDVPADVKAMATYNRALAYSSIHNDVKAAEDLATVLRDAGVIASNQEGGPGTSGTNPTARREARIAPSWQSRAVCVARRLGELSKNLLPAGSGALMRSPRRTRPRRCSLDCHAARFR